MLSLRTGLSDLRAGCYNDQRCQQGALFSKWKTTFVAQAARVFETGPELDPAQARIAELERLVGRLSLELEVAKKASRLLSAPLRENGR